MKKLGYPALAGMMLWAAMTLTEAALEMTPPSQAKQDKTYSFTIIATFGPNSVLGPSGFAEGPVITNNGTVVYSVSGCCWVSSIFSSDGTVTRLLMSGIDHSFVPLDNSVSGNGMMVTNVSRDIVDVYDGTVVGQLDPADEFHLGSGAEPFYEVSINNRGSVAFTGGILEPCDRIFDFDAGVFRFDGETTTTIASFGWPAWLHSIMALPSINERGQVAFLVGDLETYCFPYAPGIEAGDLYVGDGTRLVKIAEANSAPSLNNRGEVGFVGVNNGALSIIVSDGTRTRIVADTTGPFAAFPGPVVDFHLDVGVSLNDRGDVAFMAALDDGDLGIFTGPDVVRDKVIATGDPLAGSSVSGGIVMSRQSLNNHGQIAFQVTLADGRRVVVRAEPKKPGLN